MYRAGTNAKSTDGKFKVQGTDPVDIYTPAVERPQVLAVECDARGYSNLIRGVFRLIGRPN